jgi:hypothetical protein
MNLHRFGRCRKSRLINRELVDAKRQPTHVKIPGVARSQRVSILISAADNLHGRLHAQPGRVGNLQAQFSAIALRENRRAAKEKKHRNPSHERPPSLVRQEPF